MSIVLHTASLPQYERRIGERYEIGVPFDWAPLDTRRARRKPKYTKAITSDVSISGLGFEVPEGPKAQTGSAVLITIGHTSCQGLIRSTRPGAAPGHVHYGVEFRGQGAVEAVENLIDEHVELTRDRRTPMSGDFVQSDENYYSDRLLRQMGR